MEDSDYKRIVDTVKECVKQHVEYVKLTAIEKVSVLLSAIALFAIVLVIGGFALFDLSNSLVLLLADVVGSTWLAYLILSLALFALVLIILCNRKSWIFNPVTRFVTKLFLNPEDDDTANTK